MGPDYNRLFEELRLTPWTLPEHRNFLAGKLVTMEAEDLLNGSKDRASYFREMYDKKEQEYRQKMGLPPLVVVLPTLAKEVEVPEEPVDEAIEPSVDAPKKRGRPKKDSSPS